MCRSRQRRRACLCSSRASGESPGGEQAPTLRKPQLIQADSHRLLRDVKQTCQCSYRAKTVPCPAYLVLRHQECSGEHIGLYLAPAFFREFLSRFRRLAKEICIAINELAIFQKVQKVMPEFMCNCEAFAERRIVGVH